MQIRLLFPNLEAEKEQIKPCNIGHQGPSRVCEDIQHEERCCYFIDQGVKACRSNVETLICSREDEQEQIKPLNNLYLGASWVYEMIQKHQKYCQEVTVGKEKQKKVIHKDTGQYTTKADTGFSYSAFNYCRLEGLLLLCFTYGLSEGPFIKHDRAGQVPSVQEHKGLLTKHQHLHSLVYM